MRFSRRPTAGSRQPAWPPLLRVDGAQTGLSPEIICKIAASKLHLDLEMFSRPLHCLFLAASAHHPMAKSKLRGHFHRLFNSLRHEDKFKASGTGWDVLLSREDTHSPNVKGLSKDGMVLEASQERIVALTRELGELRERLALDRAVSDEMLKNLLPVMQVHCEGFSEAIRQFRDIERIGR